MSKRAEIELTLGSGLKGRRKEEERPLKFLVMSDLSGQANEMSTFSTHRASVEHFDRLLHAVGPTLALGAEGGAAGRFTLTGLDQFHPDFLSDRLPSLRELLDLRQALRDPANEKPALVRLAELTGKETPGESTPPGEAEPPTPSGTEASSSGENEDQLFERLLGQPAQMEPRTRARETVDSLIKEALGPASVSQPTRTAQSADAEVLELLNARCRALLLDPGFRNLERAWRSVHWLVSRLEDDEAEVHVLDIGKEALAEHLASASGNLDASPLARVLVDDEEGWDLLIGDYSFGLAPDDIVTLATIGALCARARAPFIAHGELSLAGCTSGSMLDEPWDWSHDEELGPLWSEFRRHPASAWIGLATPRFVLRYPYGSKNDPTDAFEFEELPKRPAPERFVWANPAFPCALLMGQAHGRGGAEWPSPTGGDVLDLPTPLYDDGTGEAIQAPLEFLLTERARVTAAQHGLIVFAGGRNTNRITAANLSSLAAS